MKCFNMKSFKIFNFSIYYLNFCYAFDVAIRQATKETKIIFVMTKTLLLEA